MVDTAFQALSAEDKRHALRVVQGLSGRRAHLLEKDVWVVQTLSVLFDAPCIDYEPLLGGGYGFVKPRVMVEFGARSTGEPREFRPVVCDAAAFLPDLTFPVARPSTMLAERTFWEKATAVHVFCRQERRRGERLSRHWHDLVRLDDAGIAATALADRALALSVARHKAMFFPEKDATGNRVDYKTAVSGGLQLVPSGFAREALAGDYRAMLDDGMLPDDSEPFEALIERCADIEARANELETDDG